MTHTLRMTLFAGIVLTMVACGAAESINSTTNRDLAEPARSESLIPAQPDPDPPVVTRPQPPMPKKKAQRASRLMFSTAVAAASGEPLNPQESFGGRPKKIVASFDVTGFEEGATIRVLWYRNDELIDEHDLECTGERRYTDALQSKRGLADGEYSAEVEIDGTSMLTRTFTVGRAPRGTVVVERAALGTALGKNRMPKRAKKVFGPGTKVMRCGVRFSGLAEDGVVLFQWFSLVDGAEEQLHSFDTPVKAGKSATAAASWRPGRKLTRGPYRVTISLNGTRMAELPFTVK